MIMIFKSNKQTTIIIMNTKRKEIGSNRCIACNCELKEYEDVLCSECRKEVQKIFEEDEDK